MVNAPPHSLAHGGIFDMPRDYPKSMDEPPFFIPGATVLIPGIPPALPAGAIAAAVVRPLHGPSLKELAVGKKRPVLIIEDASRPAHTAPVIASLLQEINRIRPASEGINIVFANGAHTGLAERNVREKLPPGLNLPVCQHNALSPAIPVGTSPYGNRISLNPLVVKADLRIGVCTVNPHPGAGFSGGAKLLLPGVADLKTITNNHALPPGGRGCPDCPWRREMELAAELVPLHFLVAMTVRPDGTLAGIWAGHPVTVEETARTELCRYALLPRPHPADFCLVGMKPFDRSLLGFFKSVDICLDLLAPDGIGVIAGACPDGAGGHLWRRQPKVIERTNGRLAQQLNGRRLCLLAPGVAAEEARRLLPAQIEILRDEEDLARLAAEAAGLKYVVPYGPLTMFD